MAKAQFIQQTQTAATVLANAVAACNNAAEVWTDRGYQVGGVNPLTDADLTALGVQITAAQMAAFVTLIASVQTFWQTNHSKSTSCRSYEKFVLF